MEVEVVQKPRIVAAVLVGVIVGCTLGARPGARPASGARGAATRIVLLGTGTPNAEPDRSGPSLAIVVGDRAYLVDCGPGVVRRAAAAAERGIAALRPERLDRVFITHLHSDHTLGLPDLVFTPWVLGRDHPIEVYGPPGTAAMVENIEAAYAVDVAERLGGLQPANRTGYEADPHEITPGIVFSDARVRVEAFAVKHGSVAHAFGFVFTTADGKVVVSGDTAPFDGLVPIARGAALLVHEAYATAGWARREPDWQRYHAAYHTPGHAVGEIAAAAGVGSVVLTHELLWGATPSQLVDEVRTAYSGPVYFGRDLDVFVLRAGRVTPAPR